MNLARKCSVCTRRFARTRVYRRFGPAPSGRDYWNFKKKYIYIFGGLGTFTGRTFAVTRPRSIFQLSANDGPRVQTLPGYPSTHRLIRCGGLNKFDASFSGFAVYTVRTKRTVSRVSSSVRKTVFGGAFIDTPIFRYRKSNRSWRGTLFDTVFGFTIHPSVAASTNRSHSGRVRY